jgi:hypothetical protein
MEEKKIYGFYFVALMGEWEPIVNDQISKLFSSELYGKTNKLYVRIFYNNSKDLDILISKLSKYDKVSIDYTNKNEYEFGILNKMQELSKNDDFYCYYLHSKGVSKTNNRGLIEPIKSWRIYMEYFLIEKYNLCLNELNSGWDAVGVKIRLTPNKFWWENSNLGYRPRHFSGNFWWSKSDFIKKLPDIKVLSLCDRHEAEFWIGYSNGKLKCIHDTKEAGYKQTIKDDYRS